MKDYQQFLEGKRHIAHPKGRTIEPSAVHPLLFDWQSDITVWAAEKGRCAIFLDTGLGKTFIQLEWARLLGENTLIIAPLSVARQTVREGRKIGIDVRYVRSQAEVLPGNGLWITNYEMVDAFDMQAFGAVVLDESSILKSLAGKTRRKLTSLCEAIPFRLCCTATPAPNDYTEIGNHAEFLGICTIPEMLATFFINANKEHTISYGEQKYRRKGSNKGGTEWRVKHHAEDKFFEWLASWAITMTLPSDLGYADDGFVLPELRLHPVFAAVPYQGDQLFSTGLHGIADRAEKRQQSLDQRLELLAGVISTDEQWIVWAGLDSESAGAKQILPDAVEVKGSDSPDYKARAFEAFQDGETRILITKPKIGGFGMNFQNAHKMVFLGLNDSWESFYQAVRRQWRYGQSSAVDAHIIMSDLETEVYQNVMRKDAQAKRLRRKLIDSIGQYEQKELHMKGRMDNESHSITTVKDKGYVAMLGDACERLGDLDDDWVDLSVYSPPFADLFTYTATERDLGNCRDWPEFFSHYQYIIDGVLRVTKPGRLTCVHTSDIHVEAVRP